MQQVSYLPQHSMMHLCVLLTSAILAGCVNAQFSLDYGKNTQAPVAQKAATPLTTAAAEANSIPPEPPTVSDECKDTLPNCDEYQSDMCTNHLYKLFREINCRQFCGICKGVSHVPFG
ncbi:uncharacterized protein LOC125668451 [Ostrea edulis]|uniref:uncharacterized protein LOC125668451 n=1 Tax=Ostrea edulis TaxID=37623 RepID=UPI0024AEC9A5|nr:uncharacterized protein LOC125668451 [Ostrea edulis]